MERLDDLELPAIDWRNGAPYSPQYDDLFFSRDGGLAETEHVFIAGNDVAHRLRPGHRFVVGETGFGTGLNFLATWRAWRAAGRPGELHYWSVEKHPLSFDELTRSLALFPEVQELARELLEHYPHRTPGFHPVELDGASVRLVLLFGDAVQMLSRISRRPFVDAWYLDGHAPRSNPELWSNELLGQVASLTGTGGTVSTYTVAGHVRRCLESHGFTLERRAGFGRKREMLTARLPGEWAPAGLPDDNERVAVIGGGIAGCAVAHSLARRGMLVTLFEEQEGIAGRASGNPVGIFHPEAYKICSYRERYGIPATELLRGRLQDHPPSECGLRGALYLATDPELAARQEQIRQRRNLDHRHVQLVDPAQASDLAGLTLPAGGNYFPSGGWVHPPALCRALCDSDLIDLQLGQRVAAIEHTDPVWQLVDPDGSTLCTVSSVVIANARDARLFPVAAHLPLRDVRGQVTPLRATQQTSQLRTALHFGGYLTPPWAGVHTLGATFTAKDANVDIREEDTQENVAALEAALPEVATLFNLTKLRGRAAIRTATPDHMPVVGPLPSAHFHPLASRVAELPLVSRGLHVSIGHGSRGLSSAQLAGEVIAATISGEAVPLEERVQASVSPSRFVERLIRRLS